MKALTEMTMAELVAEFNKRAEAAGQDTVGPKAFNSKGKAIARIEALPAAPDETDGLEGAVDLCKECEKNPAAPKSSFCHQCNDDFDKLDGDEQVTTEANIAEGVAKPMETAVAEVQASREEPKPASDEAPALSSDEVKAKVERAKRPEGMKPIRVRAEELLLSTVTEGEGKVIGLPYAAILATIREEYKSNTSLACLRWYATRMKEEGKHLPDRPRGKAVKAAQDVAAATAEGIKAEETPKA